MEYEYSQPQAPEVKVISTAEIRNLARDILKRIPPVDDDFKRVALIGCKNDLTAEDYFDLQRTSSQHMGGARRTRRRRIRRHK